MAGQRGFPIQHELAQAFHHLGMLRGDVVFLGAIAGRVVELDALVGGIETELPIALAHGEARPPVRRGFHAEPFPEDGLGARDRLAFERGEQVFAIAAVIAWERHAGGGGTERRRQIHAGEKTVFSFTRPAGVRPGQRTRNGVRTPPSKRLRLRPRKPPVSPML